MEPPVALQARYFLLQHQSRQNLLEMNLKVQSINKTPPMNKLDPTIAFKLELKQRLQRISLTIISHEMLKSLNAFTMSRLASRRNICQERLSKSGDRDLTSLHTIPRN
jgi:hypothetical protein